MTDSEDKENKRIEKLKEINSDRERLNILYTEKYSLEKRLQELGESIRMGRHLLAIKRTECEILTAEFWKDKQ